MLLIPVNNVRLLCSSCIFVLATLAPAAPALAASFNCAKAATPQEKAICASPKLSAADDQMAAVYRAILHAVPSSFQEEIRADQRVWIRRLAAECPANNPEQGAYLERCILGRENARTAALKQMYVEQGGIKFAWHSVFREVPGDERAEDPNDQPGSLDASWPEALADSTEWAAWNKAIAEKVHAIAGLPGPTASSSQLKSWSPNPGMDAAVSTSVNFVSSRLVTVTISGFWDGHGAHPNHDSIEFNWLLDKGRVLRPEDLFRADSQWADALFSATDQYLRKNVGDYDPGEAGKTLHKITRDPENWRIDEKGLSIVFQPYAVACYACTPQPFTMSWEQLRPFLNGEFVIPVKK